MPVYDYKCPDHGLFHELATMEDHDKPAACPQCGLLSSRVIMLAPEILAMSPEKRQAHQRNEQSQHEPIISSADRRQHDHQHRSQCGCKPKNPSKLWYTAEGNKMFPSMRPWMISH